MAWPIVPFVARIFGGRSFAARRQMVIQRRRARGLAKVGVAQQRLGEAAQKGIQLQMRVVDQDNFRGALQGLIERGSNLQPAFREIGSYILADTERRFEAEVGPDGRAWPAHSTATLLVRGAGAPKLRDKGYLYSSLSYTASRTGVAVGTNRIYAAIHQLGGQAGRGRKVTIPARPYLGLTAENRREIGAILHRHLFEQLRR